MLRAAGLDVPDTDDVKRWLQSPMIKGGGGGIQFLGSGASGERSMAVNEDEGFRDEASRPRLIAG